MQHDRCFPRSDAPVSQHNDKQCLILCTNQWGILRGFLGAGCNNDRVNQTPDCND